MIDALTTIFRDIFDDDTIVVRPDLTAQDVEGWDSLSHVRLLLAIERRFHIKFTASEVGELKTAGDLQNLIRIKQSAAGNDARS